MTKLPLLLIPLTLLAACATKPAAPAQPATATADGLTVTVRLAGDRLTEPLEVQVTVQNTGDKPALWQGSSGCPDPTRVIAQLPDGRQGQLHPIYADGSSAPRACTTDLVPHELKPGAALQSRWRWDGKVVEHMGTPQYQEVKAPGGTVTIVASFPIAEGRWLEAPMLVNRAK